MAAESGPSSSALSTLLNLVPDHPERVLTYLTQNPQLASQRDSNGYSLLHAASSYAHIPLLRTLVQTYNVDPNIMDSDNETALFFSETIEVAQCLIHELGVDPLWRNADGLTAEERLGVEDEAPLVVGFLKALREEKSINDSLFSGTQDTSEHEVGADIPPPVPPGLDISMGTMSVEEGEAAGEPDPEFRKRIEELAAREDFQGEEGQRQLRELVAEVVTGVISERGSGREVRRRVE